MKLWLVVYINGIVSAYAGPLPISMVQCMELRALLMEEQKAYWIMDDIRQVRGNYVCEEREPWDMPILGSKGETS